MTDVATGEEFEARDRGAECERVRRWRSPSLPPRSKASAWAGAALLCPCGGDEDRKSPIIVEESEDERRRLEVRQWPMRGTSAGETGAEGGVGVFLLALAGRGVGKVCRVRGRDVFDEGARPA
jgi:hypothetical protein